MPEMTPEKQKREYENLRAAIQRWYQAGGGYDTILEIASVMYATNR